MKTIRSASVFFLISLMLISPAFSASGKKVTVTGEVMDTWCYVSQVMGASQFTLGSAHHTCAVWCAAGGIPVGIRDDNGKIYMILKLESDDSNVGNLGVLDLQSHQVKVNGTLHERDGINYLLVDKVIEDKGVVNRSHDTVGMIPAFAIPKKN